MQLVLNTPGTYISKVGECFKIKVEGNSQEISAKKVEQIMITTSVALSSDVVELAVENNIDIVFLKANGNPLGRVWHSKLGSIATIRRKQLYLQDNKLGVQLVEEWLSQKLNNQISHLSKLAENRRDSRREHIKESIEKIRMQLNEMNSLCQSAKNIESIRESLQGHEGNAGRSYFETLSWLLPEQYQFQGRSKNPAEDYFNCMLNYGYGILYGAVEKACIIAGLDPYIGIMHVDNYNRKAFTFDLVEMYRIYSEEVVFRLFTTKKINDECFDAVEGGYYLNKEGKKLLITEFNKELEKKIRYKGRNIEIQNIIQYDCHQIANRILKEVF